MVLAWSWQGADMRPMALIADSANMAVFSREFFPPNFHDWRVYLSEMIISIQIALWGTVLAVICAVPLGLLCAENIAPAWVYQPVRRLMDAFRAINEMVFAMLFIVAVGLGPFAGVMALWIHTMGVLGKLFAEAIESLDMGAIDAVRSVGANRVQVFRHAVLPAVMPQFISSHLYIWEFNIRDSTILGIIGAGGLGQLITEATSLFQWGRLSTVLIVVFLLVTSFNRLSQKIRTALL
jgi:phosphonate transport system permease protein